MKHWKIMAWCLVIVGIIIQWFPELKVPEYKGLGAFLIGFLMMFFIDLAEYNKEVK